MPDWSVAPSASCKCPKSGHPSLYPPQFPLPSSGQLGLVPTDSAGPSPGVLEGINRLREEFHLALTHLLTPRSKTACPGLVQLCMYTWVCVHVCIHIPPTHLWAGRMGWGIWPHLYILWGPDGVSSALPSCLLPSDSSPLLWRGRGGQHWGWVDPCSRMVKPHGGGTCRAIQCSATSDPWPLTPVPFQSWKEGLHCCKGYPRPLSA